MQIYTSIPAYETRCCKWCNTYNARIFLVKSALMIYGFGNISFRFIIECSECILPSLTITLPLLFPQCLKLSLVAPMIKKGINHNTSNNCKFVSNHRFISKILVKLKKNDTQDDGSFGSWLIGFICLLFVLNSIPNDAMFAPLCHDLTFIC